MGRHRLLTFFWSVLPAGQFQTFGWGPFSGTLRISSMTIGAANGTAQNSNIGIFAASSPDLPSGAITDPSVIPAGWTSLNDASVPNLSSNSDRDAFHLPFRSADAVTDWKLDGLSFDITGALFYLKVWVANRTGAALDPQGAIVAEENPAGAKGILIDVRPPPGSPPPGGTTPAPPGDGTTPAPPSVPPIDTDTLSLLPPPNAGTIPQITIDPEQPLESSLEITG